MKHYVRSWHKCEVPTGCEIVCLSNRELRQANEILRKASAYFAQAELDRRFKP
jgi:transposase